MQLTFRWFGPDDPVSLAHIRQIPGLTGIVSALYDIPVGEAWPRDRLAGLKSAIEAAGLRFAVVESIPVHEDIKLGWPTRDRLIDNYRASIRAMGDVGVPVLCYNFMPVFDWVRTDLERLLEDGSTALAHDDLALAEIDLSGGTAQLPGWATAYSPEQLRDLFVAYEDVGPGQLWENLQYFLERVIPEAEAGRGAARDPSGRSTVADFRVASNHHERCRARSRHRSGRFPGQRRHVLHWIAGCATQQRPAGNGEASRCPGPNSLRALPQHPGHRRAPVSRDPASDGLGGRGHVRGAPGAA